MPKPRVSAALLDEVQRLFVGRMTAFAEQLPTGAYLPIQRPFTRDDLRSHLEQQHTYGFYLIREDNHVKVCCFDVDMEGAPLEEAYDVALDIRRALRREGVRDNAMLVEFSGSKGYHVWVFFGEWVNPRLVRDWGKSVIAKAGVTCEVYPKGDLPEGGFGNLVKLPGALHLKSGKTSRVIVPDDITVERYLSGIQPLHYREIKRLVVSKTPPARSPKAPKHFESDGSLLPCAEHIVAVGESEGARNYSMYALALQCRRAGKEQDEAFDICLQANDHFQPPLTRSQVKGKVDSAYRLANPTFDCTREFLHEGIEPHCAAKCPRYSPSFGAAREE